MNKISQTWRQQVPMLLTVSRLFFAFPIAALMLADQFSFKIVASLLFMLASATDYWDGYFARKWNAISNWGKFMDPIADKVLVTSVLLMLVHVQNMNPWLVMILVARDLIIGGVRQVAAADQIIIDANPGGKWKTALQMMAIPALIINEAVFGIPVHEIGRALIWLSTILSLTSGAQYFWAFEQARKRKS
jgi:CDP-diacylglycerol--glycerol-3-phosphate 3-phosphatidyltransferase